MSTTTRRSTSAGYSNAVSIATLPPMLWPSKAACVLPCAESEARRSSTISRYDIPSAHGEAPWLRKSKVSTRWRAASCCAIDRQLRPDPNSPCKMASGGPVPYSLAASCIAVIELFQTIFVNKAPIDLEAKAGLVADDQMTVAQLRVVVKHAVGQRIGLRPAMRLDAKRATRQRQHDMGVQFGRGMRRHHHAVLLRELSDAQRLGEPGRARRVELNVTDTARHNKIAYGKAGQLALAMRQRDRCRRGEPRKIGRLQVPMQRLFEPEDPVRLDGAGEFDALRQIVGRIHVEHQQRAVADRPAYRGNASGFLRDAPSASLELHRPVAEVEKACELFAIVGIACT